MKDLFQIQYKLFWVDIIILLGLLIAGYKYIHGLNDVLDIHLADETAYLNGGIHLIANGKIPDLAWAPLYFVWYFVLGLLQPDPMALYHLNFKVLTVVIALLTYILLRRFGITQFIALLTAFLSLLCYANLPVWPKVSHFALILILSFFVVYTFLGSNIKRCGVMVLGALVASYVRPEFFLSFILLVVILALLILLKSRKLSRHEGIILIGISIFSGGLLWFVGSPFGLGRSFLAFGQHFSWHWVEWTGSPLSPWTDWEQIIASVFGDIDSVGAAMSANPNQFFRHVTANIVMIPIKFIGLFFVHAPIVLPQAYRDLEAYILIIGIVILILLYRSSIKQNIQTNIKSQWLQIVVIGCLTLPGLISTIIIWPRTHYLLIASILWPILGICLLTSLSRKETVKARWLLLLVTIIVFITPSMPAWYRDTTDRPIVNTLNFMRSLEITEPVQILAAEGNYHVYLDSNFSTVYEHEKSTNFDQFHDDHDVNMIVLTEKLNQDSRFIHDNEWHRFLDEYENHGYIRLNVPNAEGMLLVHEQLRVR